MTEPTDKPDETTDDKPAEPKKTPNCWPYRKSTREERKWQETDYWRRQRDIDRYNTFRNW